MRRLSIAAGCILSLPHSSRHFRQPPQRAPRQPSIVSLLHLLLLLTSFGPSEVTARARVCSPRAINRVEQALRRLGKSFSHYDGERKFW